MGNGVDQGLVFDVGMHRGEDTAFYLSRGFRVVGIEANPALVEALERRFRHEIASGDLTVVPHAVGPAPGTVELAIARHDTLFSTADPAFTDVARQQGVEIDVVAVEMVTLPEVIGEHGTPRYIKVDIEGLDRAVLATLDQVAVRPPLVSLESLTASPGATVRGLLDEVALLRRLGYRRFKLVDQTRLDRLDGAELTAEGRPIRYRYTPDSSGPFGDEAPGRWHGERAIVPRMVARLARHQAFSARGWLATSSALSGLRSRVRSSVKAVAPGVGVQHPWFDLHAAR